MFGIDLAPGFTDLALGVTIWPYGLHRSGPRLYRSGPRLCGTELIVTLVGWMRNVGSSQVLVVCIVLEIRKYCTGGMDMLYCFCTFGIVFSDDSTMTPDPYLRGTYDRDPIWPI